MFLILPGVLAVIPTIILLFYWHGKKKSSPAHQNLILKVFILGVLSTVPIVFFSILASWIGYILNLSAIWNTLFSAFIVAALSEETIKLLIVNSVLRKYPELNKRADGIIYTMIAGMAFACLENVLFVFDGGLITAITRAFTAIPLHGITSAIIGLYIGYARQETESNKKRGMLGKGLLVAILIHGWYDFAIMMEPAYGWMPAATVGPLLLGSFLLTRTWIKQAIKQDKADQEIDNRKPEF